MSRIQFRQKTEEELQADAATRAKREAAARPIEVVAPAQPSPPDEAPSFALDGEPAAAKPKKSRKKPGTAA